MNDLDALPPILPPEGVTVTRLTAIAARAGQEARVDVAGVRGAADALVVTALVRSSADAAPVVVVTTDGDAANALAKDIAFLLGSDESESAGARVLVLAAPESSPYADVNPDRRAALARMATLAHLAANRAFDVLVISAATLTRKLVPSHVVRAHTPRLEVNADIDRDALIRTLSESGYLRVPVVEDPGSFAIRGSLLDVWPPGATEPARIELYGDGILSIKPFDSIAQTTRPEAELRELWLPPAREAILAERYVARARDRITQLADMIDWPTMKARVLVDDVTSGRAFFGADGYLPAYYDALATISDYAPVSSGARLVLANPAATTRAIRAELARAEQDAASRAEEPQFLPSTFFRSESEICADLAERHVVVLHGTAIAGSGAVEEIGEEGESKSEGGTDELGGLAIYEVTRECAHLAASDNEELTRAVKAVRGTKGRAGGDSHLAPVARRIAHFRDHGLRVFLTARAQTQAERLAGLLRHQDVRASIRGQGFDPAWLTESRDSADRDDVDAQILVGPLRRGVVLPGEGYVIITEEEIFGGRTHRARDRNASQRDKTRPFVEDLRSLAVGDFVVHVEHGVGRYLGLVHRDVGGLSVDLLVVEYASGDKLYLPVHRLNQIQKFSGGEAADPKIDRLGGSTFSKTKAKVEKAVRQMADELLRLYAERQAQPGRAIEPAGDDYRAFEATFPFDETEDQARAIDEVNKDLETERPMDRLVCGDVGFGKTEVAIRAAFRVAMAGRQVAVLCPTTVLAQQHFRTFEARMADYPITIRALSRFQGKKESDETLSQLKEGKVDVVIGTHRLLSKDIHFKDLGLLVVDEEQRFGVTHKERIKALRTQVDVLTLSATPIPRTLQMAVSGLRDLSLITTPPVDRRAVRTFVTSYDDQVLKEAVERELSRGGQLFYVYNRIEGIYERAQKLQKLFPSARIAVAHGQMAGKGTSAAAQGGETVLEKTMLDFVEGRFDILCATAIIESGLDIPRANTILIDRADLFGLAQLYQLRGRVGRSKERAYCYLMVPPPNKLTDDARARIEALERHTELGSGFKIASLDLELRGAGDILGAEQSGTVASVGLDMFCSMLDDAVHELRGEPVLHDVDPELSFDVSALLPEEYVSDVGVRLSLYKRLASAIDETHVAELAVEMEDRFGPPPTETRSLVRLMTLKCELRRMRILGCEATAKSVTLHLRDDTPLDPQKVLALVKLPRSPYKLTPDRLTRRFEGDTDGLANAETLLVELSRCWKDG